MSDFSDLAFFIELARQPSLVAAAQGLGITPPNVSRRLAALERRLGVRLLNRTTRRLSLTPEGHRYLEQGEQIQCDLASLERSLLASRDEVAGLLRVNATFGFGRRHLAPLVSEFARRHPQLELVLQLTDRPLDLAEHALDLGIRFGLPPDSRLVARRLLGNRRLLCAAPAYLAEHGEPLSPQALAEHRCIVIRENNVVFNHWYLTDGAGQTMVKVAGHLSSNHGEVAVDWAVAGHGIVLRSEWDVAGALARGDLRRILNPWMGLAADVYAVYPQRHHLPARVRAFVDFLAERLGDFWGSGGRQG
ncbi:LysR family transcriptional regulator [Dechloromonas sp. ZY10]|uniref:LysR family transcriptional regulator n=1 Tax=Dechloromonas aquae TaxID=2664436 RepID=UPI003527945D